MRLWMWGAGMAVLYGVLFLWFICQVRKPDYKKHYVFTKTVQSAAFLLVFLVAAGVSGDMRNLWRMLPAFVCCFAGDVLLAFYNKVREKKIFLSGLVAFLLGHLFFIRWLNRMQSITITDVVIPAMAVLLMFFVTGMGAFIQEGSDHVFWSTAFSLHTCLPKVCILRFACQTGIIAFVQWEVFCL